MWSLADSEPDAVSQQSIASWFPTVIPRLSMPSVYCIMDFRVAVLVSDICQESPRCANYIGLGKSLLATVLSMSEVYVICDCVDWSSN